MPGLFIPGLLQGSSYQGYFRALHTRVTSELFIPGLLQGSSYQGYFRALHIRVTSQLKNSLFKWGSGTETELTISTVIKDQNAQVPLGQK